MMLLVTAAWLLVRLRLKLITGVSKSPAEVNKPTTRVGKPGAVINGMVSTSPRIYHYLGFTALLLIWAFTLTAYFPGGSVEKNLPANAGDASLMPELGRPPGEGNGNPLQYSCLGNPMDRRAWQFMGLQRVRQDLVTEQ